MRIGPDFTAVRLETTVDDSEQGRLACAVTAYQAYALTLLQGEGCLVQYALITEFQRDFMKC
jgi:hypothetical protein